MLPLRPAHLSPLVALVTLSVLSGLSCASPIDPDADAVDLGSIGTKDDSATSVRTVAIDLESGDVQRFRVRAHRFHAALAQIGDITAQLSARHYDIELLGAPAADAELDAAAPPGEEEVLRNWTLRVHNLGAEKLVGELTITAIEEIPDTGGVLRETDVDVAPWQTRRFRVRGGSMRAELLMADPVRAQLSAKHYDVEAVGSPSEHPTLEAPSPGDEIRNWTVRVRNLGDETLRGRLVVRVLDEGEEPEPRIGRPDLDDPVLYENDFCTYGDSPPYVRSVAWNDPLLRAALNALPAGWHSTISYAEWRVAYGLENDRTGTDEERSFEKARNFMRVLCGELRDYPELLRQRLQVIVDGQHIAGPEELQTVDTDENLFTQLTYPAYVKLVRVMRTVYQHRRDPSENDGYHYGHGRHDAHSRRMEHSVAPWNHCEMKFAFASYLVEGAPWPNGETFETEYAAYRDSECSAEDLEWMYNFRGHLNFQPLWLESNAFNSNSRRARGAEISRSDRSYYLRPFATRHHRTRQSWATFLFYPDDHHDEMIRAGDDDGGYILYLTDQDTDGDGLADYRLFDDWGCGDNGVRLPIPSQNCNMVSWEEAHYTDSTTGHASSWDSTWWGTADMGFMRAFTTFEERMARFNQALDRHTNWGPTGYYMIDASDPGDRSPRYHPSYSPIVAASYEVSKSDFFVRRNYDTTGEFERGYAKWLFVMKFRAEHYYDEEDMRAGRPMDFDRNYFNETALSNDFYRERALDHVGYIPGAEHHAQVYLTYGHRGMEPPAPVEVPEP